MVLLLNKRIWLLAERLYIAVHGHKEFLEFLKVFDIDYPGKPYKKFKTPTKGVYLFMSHENYEFAKFMQLVPSSKYLEILSPIVFDHQIAGTKNDNWNYYGEYIKHWYPELIDLLKLAGVKLNKKAKVLEFEENESLPPSTLGFLANSFGDPFLDYMRKEINDAYANRLFLSVMFLSRKIMEAVIIRLLEVVFPKLQSGKYVAENHDLWYDKGKNRYHNFDSLLENIKSKAADFHEDKDLLLEVISRIKPFKNETNACVHSDYKIPDESDVNMWKIPQLTDLLRKLFKKYCSS